MKIRWVNENTTYLESKIIKNGWDELNNSHIDQPFLTSCSVLSALKYFGDGNQRLLLAYEDDRLVAMLVMSPSAKFQWRTFQPSQIPLGLWVVKKSIDLKYLARTLLRGPLGFCLAIDIMQIDSLNFKEEHDSTDTVSVDYIDTAWIDVVGEYSDYWSARGKNLRQNMKKQRGKLEVENIKLTLKEIKDLDDIRPAVKEFGKLESQGWKAKIGTAITPDNNQGNFYSEFLEKSSSKGEAIIYQYLMGDKVVAMNLCMLRNGILSILKTSYDESLKSYSPAFLMSEAELQLFFNEKKIKKIEYFGRIMDWHTKLSNNKRKLHHLTIYRWGILKKLAGIKKNIIPAKT